MVALNRTPRSFGCSIWGPAILQFPTRGGGSAEIPLGCCSPCLERCPVQQNDSLLASVLQTGRVLHESKEAANDAIRIARGIQSLIRSSLGIADPGGK